jgi:hypothetical protein
MLFDHEMAMLKSFLAVFPSYQRPAELCDHTVIAVPAFEVHGTPYTCFLRPDGADSLESITSRVQCRIAPSETLVIPFELLVQDTVSQTELG